MGLKRVDVQQQRLDTVQCRGSLLRVSNVLCYGPLTLLRRPLPNILCELTDL